VNEMSDRPDRLDLLVSASTAVQCKQVEYAFEDLGSLRHRQVALMLCEGLTRNEISHVLAISLRTFDCHRAAVLQLMEVRNEVELLRLAVKKGYRL
jgi:DNA-binding NarL/FixJ family response regulator